VSAAISRRHDLQLALVRVCAGLAFLPLAAPKLFAGVHARAQLAQRLTDMGLPHALQLAIVGGIIELAAGLMLAAGYYTRGAALVSALYLGASAYVLSQPRWIVWMLISASFAIAGGGRWSIDGWLGTAAEE
jgi:putative oxidoreductase